MWLRVPVAVSAIAMATVVVRMGGVGRAAARRSAAAAMKAQGPFESAMLTADDRRKYGAHNERNQEPIASMLLEHLPQYRVGNPGVQRLRVLEMASGTGQHGTSACYLAGVTCFLTF